jgi:hypothetical protein
MGLNMALTSIPQSTHDNIVPRVRAYVVYDSTTGDVLHIHHSVTFQHDRSGGENSEARALRLAGRRTRGTAVVLEVDPDEVSFDRRPIRVDIARGRIVRV